MANGYAKYSGLGGAGGGGGGVTSLNGETGAVNIVAGTNITVTPSGSNITIASTGGLQPPLEALTSYSSQNIGAAGTFLGNASDLDQTNQVVYIGSTDTSVIGNSSSNVILTTGSLTGATSTGRVGAMDFSAGSVEGSSSVAGGAINFFTGTSVNGRGGDFDVTTGSSTGSVAGQILLQTGSGASPGQGINLNTTADASDIDITSGGNIILVGTTLTFNGNPLTSGGITSLTGDITGTGPGATATTLATVNSNVGSFGSNTGIPSFTVNGKGLVTAASNNAVTTAPTASTIAAWDANSNLSTNNLNTKYTTTATAASTTTLSVTSTYQQYFTGVTTQTILLPVVSTLVNGFQFLIANTSTGALTVQTSGSVGVMNILSNYQLIITCINTAGGTAAAAWSYALSPLEGSALKTSLGGTGVSSVTTSPTASAFAGWDANKNLSANAMFGSFTTTATAAGTTALTIASTQYQAFTGVTTQTVTLPTTSVATGMSWTIQNLSTGVVTLQASAGGTVQAMAANTILTAVANAATPTTAAGWYWTYTAIDSTALPIAIGGTAKTSVTIAPTASSWAGWDASTNFSAGCFIEGFTTTATAAGTTALTITSKGIQYFTGATTQTVTLPTTSIVAGAQYLIANRSTGVVTVNSSGANLVQSLPSGADTLVTALVATPTTAANWDSVLIPQAPPTGSYSHAFHTTAASWSTTSSTFADPTAVGTPALTVRKSAGITLTTAASSLPGITFTPASSTAVYLITAQVGFSNATAGAGTMMQMTDGTTVISAPSGFTQQATLADVVVTQTISGVYAPASASAVTVKLQLAAPGGTAEINSALVGTLGNPIEWTVLRIF